MNKKILCCLLTLTVFISGCGGKAPAGQDSSGSDQSSEALPAEEAGSGEEDSSETGTGDASGAGEAEASESGADGASDVPDAGDSGSGEDAASETAGADDSGSGEDGASETAGADDSGSGEDGASETAGADDSGSGKDGADKPEAEAYHFNPHLYVPMFAEDIPQEYWDSFYNLCDALRAGEDTFECASEEAYEWATSPVTLNGLLPPACMKVTGESDDGSVPFEKGVGRIYYQIPAEEYVVRQAEFEARIEDLLNTCLEEDDDEFEKALKLYDYMASTYDYQYDFIEVMPDGANYYTIMTSSGQCVDLSSVYAYLLLQAGVQAVEVGCNVPEMAHAWTYLVIDGNGYHSDPTWALKSSSGEDELLLYYFLMSGDRRAAASCPVDDLTSPLLPKYWANFSSVEFTADHDELSFPGESLFVSLDEENKFVQYKDYAGEYELSYGG